MYLFIIINMTSYAIVLWRLKNKSIIKFIVQFNFEFFDMKKFCNSSWNLCLIVLLRWQKKHAFTYFLTFFVMFNQKYFRLKNSKIFLISKCSTCESSWFCFNNNLFILSKKTYHLFWWHNKSFTKCQLFMKLNSLSLSLCVTIVFFMRKVCVFVAIISFNVLNSSFFFSIFRFSACFFKQWKRIRCAKKSIFCNVKNAMRNFWKKKMNVEFINANSMTIFELIFLMLFMIIKWNLKNNEISSFVIFSKSCFFLF